MRRRDARQRPVRALRGTVLIHAHRIEVSRGPARLLGGVDLEVRAGEVVAVAGPNGAGKSTLLGALSGDVAVAGGTVGVDGVAVGEWSPVQLARRRAVLPQRVTVAFPFTVDQVVRMGLAPWAGLTDPDEDEIAVRDALDRCDVAHLADRPYPTLSGGEQARVSLARVLVQRTQLLLLDEPTAALDLRHQEQVFGVLRERADDGDGVVVVVHDLTAAAANADRIVLLHGGVVVADGPPVVALDPVLLAEVYQHPVDVFPNPTSGALTVAPQRGRSPSPSAAVPAARTGVS